MKGFYLFRAVVILILLFCLSFANTFFSTTQTQSATQQVTPSSELPPMIYHDNQIFYLESIDEEALGDSDAWIIVGQIHEGGDVSKAPKTNGQINFSLSSLKEYQIFQTSDGIRFIYLKNLFGMSTPFLQLVQSPF